jgi:ATP-dependent exoDNAse (exonuclease V) beta subunit
VFHRYGYDGAYADTLVAELTSLYDGSVYSRGEAIEFIERNLDAGTTPDIDMSFGQNAVTLQTIHAAKGLEYPVVIMANINQGAFPNYDRPLSSRVRYDDTLGVRHTKVHDIVSGRPHIFDSWQYDVLSGALPSDYDEERRLLYVAMTRAKRHLLFTAGENPSNFFTELDLEPDEITPAPESATVDEEATAPLSVDVPHDDGPVRTGVHDIMYESVYEAVTEGKGKEFGDAIHDFAEEYALNRSVEPEPPGVDEQRQVAAHIDTLSGELYPEQTVLYPMAGDPRIVLTGIIDLLHIADDHVDIIDYKTDRQRAAEAEYEKQLSVYHHVLNVEYPDREIRPIIYWTADDTLDFVDPLSPTELRANAEDALLD